MKKRGIGYDKILGCIFGGAIGDAMGGPLEPFDPDFVKKKFGGRITTLVDYLDEGPHWYPIGQTRGTYTDDTLLRNILCQAIVQRQGRIDACDFAKAYFQLMKAENFFRTGRQLWPGEAVVYFKLFMGSQDNGDILYMPVARELGHGNLPACDAAMMIAPIGLINAGNSFQAYWDGVDVSSVIQSGISTLAAGVVAASIAEAMRPNATVDSVVESGLQYTEGETKRRIEQAIELAFSCDTPEEFKLRFHETMLTRIADALEVVPAAMGLFVVTGGDVTATMVEGANFGRDCDTIASIAGCISGTYQGSEAIKKEWMDLVKAANTDQPDLEDLCNGLYTTLVEEKERLASHVDFLSSVLM